MTKECVFCDVVESGSNRILWEDELFYSMFDAYPTSAGHSLVIPKRHIADFEEMSDEEWADLRSAIKRMIEFIETNDLQAIYQKMLDGELPENAAWFVKQVLTDPNTKEKPDAYNQGFNDGRAAGRTVDHLHWHIIPRHAGDVDDPRGGVRYVIPSKGNYKIPRE